jgi:hypothetical protein
VDGALGRAVDARIAAFSPATVPPFTVVRDRRRRRTRQRVASALLASTATLSAVSLAVPSLGGGRDEVAGPAGDGPPATSTVSVSFAESGRDADRLAVGPCVGSLGTVHSSAASAVHVATLRATTEQLRDVVDCLQGLPGVVSVRVDAPVADTVPSPGPSAGPSAGATLGPSPAPQPPATVAGALPVPTDPPDARICLGTPEDQDCRAVGARAAADLARALGTGVRRQSAYCRTGPDAPSALETYRVSFGLRGGVAEPAVYAVPASCDPVTFQGQEYEVDPAARHLVRGLYAQAAVAPVDSALSGTAPQSVVLEHDPCGRVTLVFAEVEWAPKTAPFPPDRPPSTFSGRGTVSRNGDVLLYTDDRGAELVLHPVEASAPLDGCR